MGDPISAATITGTTTVFVALCTTFTLARFFERWHLHQRLWWDDWTMLVALIATIALCVMQFLMLQHGAGVDISHVPDDEFKKFSTLFLDLQPIARVAILFAKLSILLLYLRIFFPTGASRTTLWWLIHLTMWLNILYTVALTLATTLQCVPYGLPWGNTCINQYLVLILSSAINIVSDIIVLIIPMGSIWSLQMSRKTKWAVWALFAFGSLAPLVSIARLAYQIPKANSDNKTVVYPTVAILATAEQVVAMIGGSIPIVSATAIRLFKGTLAGSSGRNPRHRRTISQHVWPRREGHVRLQGGPLGRHGPFTLTDTLMTDSAEVIYAGEGGQGHGIEMKRTYIRSDMRTDISVP